MRSLALMTYRRVSSKLMQPTCQPFWLWAGTLVRTTGGDVKWECGRLASGSVLVGRNGRIESCHSNQSEGDARSMAMAKHVQWINMG
eukprot:scaffold421272_cov70-Attheya_sp.AAC.2